METPAPNSMRDAASPQPEIPQLTAIDDRVLVGRDGRDSPIQRDSPIERV
jgi:hypothetical protein